MYCIAHASKVMSPPFNWNLKIKVKSNKSMEMNGNHTHAQIQTDNLNIIYCYTNGFFGRLCSLSWNEGTEEEETGIKRDIQFNVLLIIFFWHKSHIRINMLRTHTQWRG